MAVAYFMFHAGSGFYPIVNKGELAILYCFVFLYLTAAGPGAFSLDGRRGRAHAVKKRDSVKRNLALKTESVASQLSQR